MAYLVHHLCPWSQKSHGITKNHYKYSTKPCDLSTPALARNICCNISLSPHMPKGNMLVPTQLDNILINMKLLNIWLNLDFEIILDFRIYFRKFFVFLEISFPLFSLEFFIRGKTNARRSLVASDFAGHVASLGRQCFVWESLICEENFCGDLFCNCEIEEEGFE